MSRHIREADTTRSDREIIYKNGSLSNFFSFFLVFPFAIEEKTDIFEEIFLPPDASYR